MTYSAGQRVAQVIGITDNDGENYLLVGLVDGKDRSGSANDKVVALKIVGDANGEYKI